MNSAINAMKEKIVSLHNGRPLEILDAGCGNALPFGLGGIPYHLTGIDFDQNALDLRKDLHKSIHGDLCKIELPPESFDIIYNSFVIEHVHDAEKMLLNFVKWLKPGGIICIHFPDGKSVTGWMTRMMPHSVKVWAHKIKGNTDAGKPGHAPYPAVYELIVCREGIQWFCRRNDLTIEKEFLYSIHLTNWWKKTAAWFMSVLSLGSLDWSHEAVSMIIRK